MKLILILWAAPLALFWGWYFLSLNDLNFGFVFLTRDVHDVVFQLYGAILGIDPAALPGMLARGFAIDTLLLAVILAFRRRRAIRAWWAARKARYEDAPAPST